VISVSPAAAIRPAADETPRERVLTDDELAAVLAACAGLGAYGQGIRLLLLSGQRRSEILNMAWSEIDLPGKTWNLPRERAKNNRAHQIPLCEPMLDCLRGLCPAIESGLSKNPVFQPVSFSRMKGELDALLPAGMPAWVLHDLRRSAASGMASLGVQLPVIEKVLNHQSGSFRGVCGIYQRHSYATEKRAALDLWGAHVAALPVNPVALAAAA
jgi:integrase